MDLLDTFLIKEVMPSESYKFCIIMCFHFPFVTCCMGIYILGDNNLTMALVYPWILYDYEKCGNQKCA